MAVSPKGAAKKGRRNEDKAVAELNRWFKALGSSLGARRVPGSGNKAFRAACPDRSLLGDVRILRGDGHGVARIEVKAGDPNSTSGPWTAARIRREGDALGMIMVRHDRGVFLCGLTDEAWGKLLRHNADPPMWNNLWKPWRGVPVEEIQDIATDLGGLWLHWNEMFFGTVKQLAELFHEAYDEGLAVQEKE